MLAAQAAMHISVNVWKQKPFPIVANDFKTESLLPEDTQELRV